MTVRAAANCDEVELFLNDTSLGRHVIPGDACFSDWTVPYAPGALSAVGYRAGKQVAAQKLSQTGAPERVQITPVKLPFASDLTFYETTIVDNAGLTVPSATNAVTVSVQGPGRLIGLDTGELNYGGLFKTGTRDAYQGRLLATVQRTAPGGELRLTAVAQGLAAAASYVNP
jgi:beta-galactosidase